jgi:hypothetical protein
VAKEGHCTMPEQGMVQCPPMTSVSVVVKTTLAIVSPQWWYGSSHHQGVTLESVISWW